MATEEDFDRWIEITKDCKYLPENELKVLYTVNDPCLIIRIFIMLRIFS